MTYVVARRAYLEELVQELGAAYARTLSGTAGLVYRNEQSEKKPTATAKAVFRGRIQGREEAMIFMVLERWDCSEDYARETVRQDLAKMREAIEEDEKTMREGL